MRKLLILALLSACAAKPTVWDKDGGTQVQFDRDKAKCEFEAEKVRALVDWRTTNTAIAYQRTLEACMRAEGYIERRM
jgi:hypothetical protein